MNSRFKELEKVEVKKVRFAEGVENSAKRLEDAGRAQSCFNDEEDSPLVVHKKHKSSDYSLIRKVELPSIDEILQRILKHQRNTSKENVDRTLLNFSPIKVPPVRHKSKNSPKKHFRSSSPLKRFNDRIFQIRRLIHK
jgi:hypothetical protein